MQPGWSWARAVRTPSDAYYIPTCANTWPATRRATSTSRRSRPHLRRAMTAPGNSGQSADASARPINILIYPQNGAGVRIVALGLHKAAFFNVVQALHDGH